MGNLIPVLVGARHVGTGGAFALVPIIQVDVAADEVCNHVGSKPTAKEEALVFAVGDDVAVALIVDAIVVVARHIAMEGGSPYIALVVDVLFVL